MARVLVHFIVVLVFPPGFPPAINRVLVVFLYFWSLWVRPQLTTQLGWPWEPRWAPYCGHKASDTQTFLTPAAYCCVCVHAQLLQSWPTLCETIDGSPSGSPVPGILQARILEWVAISSSNAWKWKVKVKSLSHAQLLATPWTAAHQAPPSMGSSRQDLSIYNSLLAPLYTCVSRSLCLLIGTI